MKEQKSAGIIVYYLDQEKPVFLMLKYPSYWGFSKGLIEQGEDEKKAAIRELEEEETGIKVTSLIPGFEEKQEIFFKLNNEFIKKFIVFFLAKISESQAKETKISWEHDAFSWLNLEEAIAITRIKANKELLKKASEFILEHEKQKKLF